VVRREALVAVQPLVSVPRRDGELDRDGPWLCVEEDVGLPSQRRPTQWPREAPIAVLGHEKPGVWNELGGRVAAPCRGSAATHGHEQQEGEHDGAPTPGYSSPDLSRLGAAFAPRQRRYLHVVQNLDLISTPRRA